MRKKIINYLVQQLLSSMTLYWVNGTPEKRLFRVKEVAKQIYAQMSKKHKQEVFDKIKSDIKPPL